MGREEFRAMGTTVSLLLPSAFLKVGAEATRQLFAQWEQILSRFLPESELSHLNQQAGTPVKVSDLLFHVTRAALTAAQETEGLFDPTLLTQLMQVGYDRTFDEVPTIAPAAKPSHPGGGWREVRLNHWKRSITLPKGVGLEFGGIAKGMAVDAALTQLHLLGVQAALVNAGGDLATMGLPDGYESWPLAIAGKDISWSIPFQHGALATSGIAKRHWQQGNLTRHHLIDPRTGEPSQSGLWSVTVAAGSCERAEVAAKVAFLRGPERGKDFLQDHGLSGLLVHTDGHWTSAGVWPVTLMQALENEQ
jgi:thiamine biosynthesis lipoprotein